MCDIDIGDMNIWFSFQRTNKLRKYFDVRI